MHNGPNLPTMKSMTAVSDKHNRLLNQKTNNMSDKNTTKIDQRPLENKGHKLPTMAPQRPSSNSTSKTQQNSGKK